ncbi:MAG: hypothetical protein ABR567_17985 [Myxococcales bacterium]|nr:hypothetical protein [Myxococcales bacterium]
MRAWLPAAVALLAPAVHAAHVTDVADAADEKHTLEVDLDATYNHMRAQTTITREQGAGLTEELKHVRTLDTVDLRLGIGLWHDLELHALAPIAVRDVQEWSQAGPTSTLSTNTISPSGCAAAGSCTAVQPILPIPGKSEHVGFFDPTVGITWGPINEERELRLKPELYPPGKPVSTWVIGFDWTFPMPGGKLDGPSSWGAASALGGTRPAATPESRKAHVFTLWTAFSKRYKVLEPYLVLAGTAPFAAKGAFDNCHAAVLSDVAPANCAGLWAGETGYKPPWEGLFSLGAELVAAEDVIAERKLSFEIRGDVRWHGPGRDYTQVTDALGKLTYADEYVTTGGQAGIYGRISRWFHLRVYGTLAVDSAHFLTHEDIGDDKNNDGKITISGGSGSPAPDQNPVYDFRLDQVGRRLRAAPSLIWGVAGNLSLNF